MAGRNESVFGAILRVFVDRLCRETGPDGSAAPERTAGSSESPPSGLVEAERERLNNGAKPLMLDPELMRAAQTHSDDMAMKHSFDVDNPEGNVAVNVLLENPKFRGFVGREFRSPIFHARPTDRSQQSFAQEFLSIWENSPDHRFNIPLPGLRPDGHRHRGERKYGLCCRIFATDLGLPEPQ